MTPEERRKYYKEQVARSQKKGFATKDDNPRFGGIFNEEMMDDVRRWKCKEMDHLIRILSYIAGKRNPKFKEGEACHFVEVSTHSHVGVSDTTIICPKVTYGVQNRCAVCEKGIALLKEDPDDKDAKKLTNPSRRMVYQIICLDNEAELQKGVQVWETTQWGFSRKLDTVAEKRNPEVFYADPDLGYVIHFSKKGKGLKDTEYTITDLEKREPCPDNINIYRGEALSLITLENLLYVPTYEETHNLIKDYEVEQEEKKDTESKEPECPFGGTFGKDFTAEAEECVSCKLAHPCSEKSVGKKPFTAAKPEEVKSEVKEEPKKEEPKPEVKEEPKKEEIPTGRVRRFRSGS